MSFGDLVQSPNYRHCLYKERFVNFCFKRFVTLVLDHLKGVLRRVVRLFFIILEQDKTRCEELQNTESFWVSATKMSNIWRGEVIEGPDLQMWVDWKKGNGLASVLRPERDDQVSWSASRDLLTLQGCEVRPTVVRCSLQWSGHF